MGGAPAWMNSTRGGPSGVTILALFGTIKVRRTEGVCRELITWVTLTNGKMGASPFGLILKKTPWASNLG